jgi:hypothetical protein
VAWPTSVRGACPMSAEAAGEFLCLALKWLGEDGGVAVVDSALEPDSCQEPGPQPVRSVHPTTPNKLRNSRNNKQISGRLGP